MNLNQLFELFDGILGDIATFQGLHFTLPHGVLVVDYVEDCEFDLEGGGTENVSGFIIDFVPYDELQSTATYFALDEEGVKYIISEFILE